MFDTTDLTSYISGYDCYCEQLEHKEKVEENDDYDDWYNNKKTREESMKMERKIIDLGDTNLTLDQIYKLENYIWQGDKLIPIEKLKSD